MSADGKSQVRPFVSPQSSLALIFGGKTYSRRTLCAPGAAQSPESFSRPGLSQEEVEELKEAFMLFDQDNKGFIESKELKAAMENLGYKKTSKMVYQMIESLGKAKKEITFPDFLDLMTAKISDTDSRDDVMKVFKIFDQDSTNFITIENLRQVAQELGETMSEEELTEMITRADSDGDGKINFEDFFTVMTKKNFA